MTRAAPIGTWDKRAWVHLALLTGLLWLVQGAEVLSLADVFFTGDAAEKAAGSKALVDGLDVPRHWLVYHDFEGGGFLSMNLVALGFACFGQTLLAVGIVAALFNSLMLAVGYAFSRDAFGHAAGVVFGLLFVLQPESFQKIALIVTGSHYHGLIAVPPILLYSSRIAFDGDARRRTWFLLGLSLGFAFYLTYQNALPIGIAGATVLARRGRDLLRPYARFGWLGLVLGLAPWFWMLSRVGSGVLEVHGDGLGEVERTSVLAQQTAFLGSIWRGREALDLVALALVTLAPLTALFAKRSKALYVASFLAVFTLVYVFAGFAVGSVTHYFWFNRASPFVLYGSLLSSAGIGALLLRSEPRLRAAGRVLLAALVVFGARDVLLVLSEGRSGIARNWTTLTRVKGYQYVGYLKYVAAHVERGDGGIEAKAAVLLGYDEADPALLRASIAADVSNGTTLTEVEAWLAQLASDERRDFALGLGPWWSARHGGRLPAAAAAVESAPPILREHLFEAVGRFGAGWFATERRLAREIELGREHGWPASYFRGLGYRLARVRAVDPQGVYHRQLPLRPYLIEPDAAEAFLERQDADVRELLRAGYELALADHSF